MRQEKNLLKNLRCAITVRDDNTKNRSHFKTRKKIQTKTYQTQLIYNDVTQPAPTLRAGPQGVNNDSTRAVE